MRNRPKKSRQLRSYFAHHLRVSLASLGRLYRQPIATLMTAAVIAIALALPAGLYIGLANIGQLSSGWDGSTQISLFLHTSVKKSEAKKLKQRLEKHKDIKKVELIDKEKGLQQFKEISGFGDALKYLDTNPLPIVLVVHPRMLAEQPDRTTKLVKDLAKNKRVELAQLDVQWVKRLYTFLEIANRIIWVISSMLAIAVLLIIGNTIRLDIQNRREEIEVSKLIGASDAFIRRPFLYTGFWYGFIGGALAWFITLLSLMMMESPIHKLALLYHSDFRLSGLGFGNTLLLIFISCALGLVGSWIAVSRHLKEIEPS
ncbi:Cell-division-associated, ABC-transporter-like signaling protein FtsX [hydrothermal vent metagenome]|uniref:Cell division protein FtsX n=1 Tax=hydrothermal vent metagenome TaxID=652676 RepID=A0A3B0W317_9ZZZZ